MIQMGTLLAVADNSGAKKVLCIKVLRKGFCAGIGDVIVISIRKAIPNGKVKEGQVHKAVIVRTKKSAKRIGGNRVAFDDNAVVLVNNQHEMIGKRVFGIVGRELRDSNFNRVVSLAKEVI